MCDVSLSDVQAQICPRVCRQGGGCANAPLQEPKKSANLDCTRFKMVQNDVVMVGLTVSMHFQQLEKIKLQNVTGEACPEPP